MTSRPAKKKSDKCKEKRLAPSDTSFCAERKWRNVNKPIGEAKNEETMGILLSHLTYPLKMSCLYLFIYFYYLAA